MVSELINQNQRVNLNDAFVNETFSVRQEDDNTGNNSANSEVGNYYRSFFVEFICIKDDSQ